ncbi:hypothetical protein ACLB2K_070064 [Fragaria x ananassa]
MIHIDLQQESLRNNQLFIFEYHQLYKKETMGEAVLGAFLPVLLEKLADQEITEYFGRVKGVDKKVLEKWTRTLTAIEEVLSDAEEKQLTRRAVKEWLDDLRDLAYDVQDVLDIFDTKMLQRRIERQQGSKSKLLSSLSISKVKSNFGLNSAIKKISDRLEEITTREKQFDLKKLGASKKPWKMPPTTYQLDGPVIGRDEAKDKILSDLLSKQENYHVVGIVGTGGVGKTTLAKHVFNDAATGQFSPKGWVSVSDDFDIVRVAAAVLESVTSAPVQEFKELNSILEKLSKELTGKKFLIVLDDVWDTCSYDQWTTLQASFRVGAAGSKTHHALLNNRPEDVEFLKEKIVEKCNGLPLAARTLVSGYLAHNVTSYLLTKLHYLRLLSLNGYQITELPDTIGELKHLRYLDLSDTGIRSLPDSTTTLYNLQTLLLKSCDQLKALPTSMRNLVNLRHLNNSGTRLLEEMPPQLGQLTNLQTLPEFVIGKGSGSGVREIESLLHLQGTLHISRLENVICVEDARSANLKSKERLEALFLEWSSSSVSTEDAAIVLDMLQPHSKLKKLIIEGYAGLKFPKWIGDTSFSTMVQVMLDGCNHCQFLPPFGQLPCLKELYIQEMDAVESAGVEFYGEGNLPFQALKTLKFWNLKNWKKWSPHCQQNEGVGVFSCLTMLSIRGCPKLEGDLPEKLDSLAQLQLFGCEELVVSVYKYKQLHRSYIGQCKMVVYDTSTVGFDLLESLTISNIPELRFQTEAFMKSLKNVKELKITGCEELTCCFQNEDRLLQHLISLGRLYIEDNSILVEKLGIEAEQLVQLQILDCNIEHLELSKCGSLVKVPERLHHFRSLQELHISKCFSLVSFPDVGLPSCLQVIVIEDCEYLLYFAKYQISPNLKRIEIENCGNLKSLIEKEEEVGNGSSSSSSCLERLMIRECSSLMCLLCKGQLPRSLKQLLITCCGQLELITERFLDDSCQLEEIHIWKYPNLKSLPEGLCDLTDLRSLIIFYCQSLVSLPRMNAWPRNLSIGNCDKLEVAQLARDMMHTSNLEKLELITLKRLASLTGLHLSGKDDGGLVSFPPAAENSKETEILLPRSLVNLTIAGFPNLKKLSKGFQFLTSLESLYLYNCPKLTTLPVEEGLPLSLARLYISNCPLLEERYKGRYRHKIAHIPQVLIN